MEENKKLEGFNLLEIIGVLWRWRKLVLIMVAVIVIGTIIVSLFLPNYYMAQATVVPANEEKDLFGEGSKNNSIYGDEDAIDRAIIFANSRALIGYMVQKFQLAERYDIDVSTPKGESKVAKRFLKLYNVKKNEHSGIEISIEDTAPEFAAEMTQAVIQKLEELYKSATAPTKSSLLATYENALQEKKQELRVISDTLSKLRRKYSIFDVEKQGEMLAKMLVSTESQLSENRAKLKAFKRIGRQDSALITSARVEGLERKLAMLNSKDDSLGSSISLERFNTGKEDVLYYENQIESLNEDIGEILTEYSQFRAQATSQASAIIVLEPVEVPKVKSYPVRSLMVIAAAFIAFIIAILTALMLEFNKQINWKQVFAEKPKS